MNKKQLLIIAPALLMTSALVGCKSGGDTPQPTPERTLESISASAEGISFFVGEEIKRSNVIVTAKYSDSKSEVLGNNEPITFSPALPYTFESSDSVKFDVSYKDKTCSFTVTPKTYPADIDWNTTPTITFSGKEMTLHQAASISKNIFIGNYSDYGSYITGLKSYNVGEPTKTGGKPTDDIKAYVDEDTEGINNLYILSSGIITFGVNDLIPAENLEEDPNGLFYGLVRTETISMNYYYFDEIKSYKGFFANCTNLKDIFINKFYSSVITSMESMFANCSSLRFLDLSGFVTEQVKTFDTMFAKCAKLETIIVDPKEFKISEEAVRTSAQMFEGCTELLTGEKNTAWENGKVDTNYARVDGGKDSPGYFTSSESGVGKFLKNFKSRNDLFQYSISKYDPKNIKAKIFNTETKVYDTMNISNTYFEYNDRNIREAYAYLDEMEFNFRIGGGSSGDIRHEISGIASTLKEINSNGDTIEYNYNDETYEIGYSIKTIKEQKEVIVNSQKYNIYGYVTDLVMPTGAHVIFEYTGEPTIHAEDKFLNTFSKYSDKFSASTTQYTVDQIKITDFGEKGSIKVTGIDYGEDEDGLRYCEITHDSGTTIIAGKDYSYKNMVAIIEKYKQGGFKFELLSGTDEIGIKMSSEDGKTIYIYKFNSEGYLLEYSNSSDTTKNIKLSYNGSPKKNNCN